MTANERGGETSTFSNVGYHQACQDINTLEFKNCSLKLPWQPVDGCRLGLYLQVLSTPSFQCMKTHVSVFGLSAPHKKAYWRHLPAASLWNRRDPRAGSSCALGLFCDHTSDLLPAVIFHSLCMHKQ